MIEYFLLFDWYMSSAECIFLNVEALIYWGAVLGISQIGSVTVLEDYDHVKLTINLSAQTKTISSLKLLIKHFRFFFFSKQQIYY